MTQILLIMAHPDDAFVWCGGLILESLKLNAEINIVSLSTTDNKTEKEISEIAGHNGIGYQSFSKNMVSESRICDLLSENGPDLIITHWMNDTHDYHRKTAEITEQLLKKTKLKCYKKGGKTNFRIFQCDTYYSLGQDGSPFPGKIILDISDSFQNKISILKKACGKYLSLIEPMVRIQNAFYGGKIGQQFAEPFLESSSLASIGGGLGKITARNIVDPSWKGLHRKQNVKGGHDE